MTAVSSSDKAPTACRTGRRPRSPGPARIPLGHCGPRLRRGSMTTSLDELLGKTLNVALKLVHDVAPEDQRAAVGGRQVNRKVMLSKLDMLAADLESVQRPRDKRLPMICGHKRRYDFVSAVGRVPRAAEGRRGGRGAYPGSVPPSFGLSSGFMIQTKIRSTSRGMPAPWWIVAQSPHRATKYSLKQASSFKAHGERAGQKRGLA